MWNDAVSPHLDPDIKLDPVLPAVEHDPDIRTGNETHFKKRDLSDYLTPSYDTDQEPLMVSYAPSTIIQGGPE